MSSTSSVSSLFKKGKRKNWNHSLSKRLSQSSNLLQETIIENENNHEEMNNEIEGFLGEERTTTNMSMLLPLGGNPMNTTISSVNNSATNGWIEEIENHEPIIHTGGKTIIVFESLNLNHPSDYFKQDENEEMEEEKPSISQHHWKNKNKKASTVMNPDLSSEFPALGEEMKNKEEETTGYLKKVPEKSKVTTSNTWSLLRSTNDSDSEDEKMKTRIGKETQRMNTFPTKRPIVNINAITSWIKTEEETKKKEENENESHKKIEKKKEEIIIREESSIVSEETMKQQIDIIVSEKSNETNEKQKEGMIKKDPELVKSALSRFGTKKKKKKSSKEVQDQN